MSYRRNDSEGEAGRLYDDLVRAYGNDAVFMDVAGIDPGLDFRKAIDDNVAGCGVFLAIIGSQWATITGDDGRRRLDDDNDFVRLEIASALARNIAVIPVLVHDARMPRHDQLPDNIKDLAYRNSVEISHARWNSDVKLLVDALKQYVTTNPATENQPVHAAVPVQLPPPISTEPAAGPVAKKSRTPIVLAAVAAVLILAIIGYFLANRKPTLSGVWRNTQPRNGTDALLELRIKGSGPNYAVEPFGQCDQGQCSWGTRDVVFQDGHVKGEWAPRNTPEEISERRTVDLTLQPLGEKLRVDVHNSWFPQQKLSQQKLPQQNSPLQSSQQQNSILEYTFERQP